MTESAAWRVVLRGVLLAISLVALGLLLGQLQAVIIQFALAVLLAAAANPLVDGLTLSATARRRRFRIARGLAALLVFLAGLLLLVGGGLIVVATVGPDLRQLAIRAPDYVIQAERFLEQSLAANPDLAARLSDAVPSLQGALGGAVGLVGQASRLVSVATSLVSGVLYLVFTLILALYLTMDGDRIRRYVILFLPFDRQDQALHVSERIGVRLGAWARGEALLALIIGVLTWIGALVLGLPYAGALALVAAVGELVPNLGPIIAAVPLVVVGFLSSPTQGVLALLLAILIQQLENNLVVPRVMSRAVNLHPVVVMLAILSGGELLGIPGALMAVPLVASLSVIVDEIQRERLEKHLALDDKAS
jgi:predicted PurR-regulated permease PerM